MFVTEITTPVFFKPVVVAIYIIFIFPITEFLDMPGCTGQECYKFLVSSMYIWVFLEEGVDP